MKVTPESTVTVLRSGLTPPARSRRSLLLGRMFVSTKKRQLTCAARDATAVECSLSPLDGVRWCSRHNEERLKLYMSYKHYDALLKRFSDTPACQDRTTIKTCDSLSDLREWNAHLREKYNLLTKCIEARVYFTRKFFGKDMDFGHKTYWDSLVQKRVEVEKLMLFVENHGYQLMLREQNALWVLARDAHKSGNCSDHEDLARGADRPLHSTDNLEGVATEDPLEAILREKANEFKEKIRMHLAWYCAPSTSRHHGERQEVIYAYVRRAVYKDASLTFLSHSYDSVKALFNSNPSDQVLDLITMEKLWNAIRTLCVHDLQSAVDDVVRSTDGDHVVVLGGKVFKDTSGERWPLHAWGHITAIHWCYSCLRKICRTIDQVIDLTRYALWTGVKLSHFKYDFSDDGSKELILAGFIIVGIPLTSPRHSIAYKECGSHSVWEETEYNLSLSGGLSLNDLNGQAFVNACIRHPDLMVMLRKGANGRVLRFPSVVWISRARHAQSRSGLADMPWEKTTDVTTLSDSELEDAQPSGWERTRIADCMQVVIVDTGKGTVRDFFRKLIEIWCQVYKVGNEAELYNALRDPYEDAGELEAFQEVTDEIVRAQYHPCLWGGANAS